MLIIILSVCVGVIAGFLSGLFGLGGGVIVVPALFYVFHLMGLPESTIMHCAIATSLAVMLVTASASVQAHYARGKLRTDLYRQFMGFVWLAVIIGVCLTHYIGTRVLSVLFALYLLFTAYKLMRQAGVSVVGKKIYTTCIGRLVGSIAGVLSGLIGIGGGTVLVPFLSRFISIQEAAGVAAMNSACVAVIGTLTWSVLGMSTMGPSIHFIRWTTVLYIAVPSFLMAPLGVRLAYRLPVSFLKRCFSVILLFIAIDMLW